MGPTKTLCRLYSVMPERNLISIASLASDDRGPEAISVNRRLQSIHLILVDRVQVKVAVWV
jgi:hypothetical protein